MTSCGGSVMGNYCKWPSKLRWHKRRHNKSRTSWSKWAHNSTRHTRQ